MAEFRFGRIYPHLLEVALPSIYQEFGCGSVSEREGLYSPDDEAAW